MCLGKKTVGTRVILWLLGTIRGIAGEMQFICCKSPIISSELVTVHKAEGQTYENAGIQAAKAVFFSSNNSFTWPIPMGFINITEQ